MSIALVTTPGTSAANTDDPGHHIVTTSPQRGEVKAALAPILNDSEVTRLMVFEAGNLDGLLGAVLTRLLIANRLDLEIGYVAASLTPAVGAYGLTAGAGSYELARHGHAEPVPLIRDDTGTALAGGAILRGPGGRRLHGEAYVDSHRLFTGTTKGIIITPTLRGPGVRATLDHRWRWQQQWVPGRAVQTGGVELHIERDGIPGDRSVTRSTFYRDQRDWKLVRLWRQQCAK